MRSQQGSSGERSGPEGLSPDEPRRGRAAHTRRAQVAGGLIAALATFAPIVIYVRGSRVR